MIVRLALVGICLVAAVSSAPGSHTKDGNFELIILHNNDMHARFEQTSALSGTCTETEKNEGKCYGGFARVAHEIRKYRKQAEDGEIPSVLYLNAGDTYTGTPWFSIFKDNITASFLNLLKPDAIVRTFTRILKKTLRLSLILVSGKPRVRRRQ